MLSALGVNAELLVERAPDVLGDEVRRYAAINQRLLGRMNTLSNDLLDVASIEAGSLACLLEHVEVRALVHETLEFFQPLAASKHITLDGGDNPIGEPLHARLDAGRILQVLANLVSNALKFTPRGGRLSIRVFPEGEDIKFTVSDTGIGISSDALLTVFDRFHQVSKTRGGLGLGLGLGLHISKSIVEAHGGRLWAESTLGTGSTFHFELRRWKRDERVRRERGRGRRLEIAGGVVAADPDAPVRAGASWRTGATASRAGATACEQFVVGG